MLTSNVKRDPKGLVTSVDGKPPSDKLKKIRIPPAWEDLMIDPDPHALLVAIGVDSKGRKQYLYSPEHHAQSKDLKFQKVRQLIEQHEDIRSEIEEDINHRRTDDLTREAALVAYLLYETGIRPGSNAETLGDVKAFGATTLQLRHVKPCVSGVRLKFTGKKGVKQNVLITNPYLVQEIIKRKEATTAYTTPLFDCPVGRLRDYIKRLGTGGFCPKDLRTMRGTLLAIDLIGWRVRIPKTKKGKKVLVNNMLDKVAGKLGNTRAVTRSAYVDPCVCEHFTEQADPTA